jgi:hypothetical protein
MRQTESIPFEKFLELKQKQERESHSPERAQAKVRALAAAARHLEKMKIARKQKVKSAKETYLDSASLLVAPRPSSATYPSLKRRSASVPHPRSTQIWVSPTPPARMSSGTIEHGSRLANQEEPTRQQRVQDRMDQLNGRWDSSNAGRSTEAANRNVHDADDGGGEDCSGDGTDHDHAVAANEADGEVPNMLEAQTFTSVPTFASACFGLPSYEDTFPRQTTSSAEEDRETLLPDDWDTRLYNANVQRNRREPHALKLVTTEREPSFVEESTPEQPTRARDLMVAADKSGSVCRMLLPPRMAHNHRAKAATTIQRAFRSWRAARILLKGAQFFERTYQEGRQQQQQSGTNIGATTENVTPQETATAEKRCNHPTTAAPGKWTCTVCTFANHLMLKECEMCAVSGKGVNRTASSPVCPAGMVWSCDICGKTSTDYDGIVRHELVCAAKRATFPVAAAAAATSNQTGLTLFDQVISAAQKMVGAAAALLRTDANSLPPASLSARVTPQPDAPTSPKRLQLKPSFPTERTSAVPPSI